MPPRRPRAQQGENQAVDNRAEQAATQGRIMPWQKTEVCRLLATNEVQRSEIARRYGVTRQAITQFAQRHAREIEEIRERLDDEFAGQWIAEKRARIDALQAEYEAAMQGRLAGHHEWIKTRTAILRAVAEELGQIPNRSSVQVTGIVTHRLIGVDIERAFPPMIEAEAADVSP